MRLMSQRVNNSYDIDIGVDDTLVLI